MLYIIASALFFGYIAHGFYAANMILSHDALPEFYMSPDWNRHFISLGRYLVPIITNVFGTKFAVPWVTLFISLIIFSVSIYMICSVFDIYSALNIILMSGIMITNKTIITQVSNCQHLLITFSLAMMFSTAAFYCWERFILHKNLMYPLFAALFLICSMALYQSYISLFVTLVVIYSIRTLFNKKECKTILLDGMWAILILLLSGAVYYITLVAVSSLTRVQLETGSYHSLSNIIASSESVLSRLINSAATTVFQLTLNSFSVYSSFAVSGVNLLLLAVLVAEIIRKVIINKFKVNECIFLLALLFFLPIAMSLIRLLTDTVHDVMLFSICMFYIMFLVFDMQVSKRKNLAMCLLAFIIYNNCVSANAVYAKKVSDEQSTFAIMNNVAYDIEKMSDYKAGETKVIIIGMPSDQQLDFGSTNNYSDILHGNIETTRGITDIDFYRLSGSEANIIAYENKYYSYFQWYLRKDINLIGSGNYVELMKLYNYYDELTKGMPIYPTEGYIKYVEDVLVVRLS